MIKSQNYQMEQVDDNCSDYQDEDDDDEGSEKEMRVDETLFPFCLLTRASSL